MLKADYIELAILNLLIDWNTFGSGRWRWFNSRSLMEAISISFDGVTESEAIDALLDLLHRQLIELHDCNSVRYQSDHFDEFFSGPNFRCQAQFSARRRQQELAGSNRRGIFISHISEESAVATRLKTLFESALSNELPIFVSSDFESIESGDPWYERILEGIGKTQVLITLLSAASIDRRWINFESGVGVGQGSRVIPVVWRRLSKGDIGMPLGRHHARDLSDEGDLKALLTSLGTICHVPVNEASIGDFLRDLSTLENKTTFSGLEVTPFRRGAAICLAIRNIGNRPLDMIDAELLVPAQCNAVLHPYAPVRERIVVAENGIQWTGYRLTTSPSASAHLGFEPLRPVLAQSMGELVLDGIAIGLHKTSIEEGTLSIRYRVAAKQMEVGPLTSQLGRLPTRE